MTDETGGQTNIDTTTETQETGAEGTLLTDGAQGEQAVTGEVTSEAEGVESEGKAEGETTEAVAPEEYEFAMPEGMEMDKGMADAIGPMFKELNLSQEQANSITDAYAKQIQSHAEAQQTAFTKQLDDWASELKNDSEVGGDAFKENTGIAANAIKVLGSPELSELMESTGMGNNPAMFKFALAVGRALAEDQPGSSGIASDESVIENRMYPNETAVN